MPHERRVGHELDRCVKPRRMRVDALVHRERLDPTEERLTHALADGLFTPDRCRPHAVWEVPSTIDQKQRPAFDPDVPRVAERTAEPADVHQVVLDRVALIHQHVAFEPVPGARPVLVGPAQAEWQVGLTRRQDLVKGPLQEAAAREPVMIVAKPGDPVFPSEVSLGPPGIGEPEVVKPQVGRQVGLLVTLELRTSPGYIGPLGESRAPPLLILGDRMELRQIERDQADWVRVKHRMGSRVHDGSIGHRLRISGVQSSGGTARTAHCTPSERG